LGYQPTSFRAGRFGAGNNTIVLLEELGYLVDSSVTPGIDWNLPEGRANFLKAREQPYFPDKNNILKTGNSNILEVPISIINPYFRKLFYSIIQLKSLSLINIGINFLSPVRWLRPSCQSANEMLSVIKDYLRRYGNNNPIVLNMMFHSMEIISNASPYTKTEEECLVFLEKMETVFQFCLANNINFVTLSELYPLFANKVKDENSYSRSILPS
jgi:hypothetical protein